MQNIIFGARERPIGATAAVTQVLSRAQKANCPRAILTRHALQ